MSAVIIEDAATTIGNCVRGSMRPTLVTSEWGNYTVLAIPGNRISNEEDMLLKRLIELLRPDTCHCGVDNTHTYVMYGPKREVLVLNEQEYLEAEKYREDMRRASILRQMSEELEEQYAVRRSQGPGNKTPRR